ncbi:MAG: putative drug exporter of the superfamily [Solirubrobacteraceae bacterium]|nr:putative drug exporter of the superfamily [Solirubrobacteraceae bacterium]
MQPSSSGHRSISARARFAATHPWAVLSVWLVVVALLGTAGLGIDGRLSAGGLQVSNSESSRARTLIGGSFGDAATLPVLLRGPRVAVKRQGKKLVHALSKRPGVRVLSPWSASSGKSALRPSRGRALLLLTISGTRDEIARRSQAAQRLVDDRTAAPVRATITGMPLLTSEGTRRTLSAIHRAELIALPLLFVALLLVFQSLAAALIPAAFGAASIASSTGALWLLASAVQLDAFALAISCMVGLALAVDYSLLMVSRVREELAGSHGGDVRAAVARGAAPTTRTVAVAAAAIVVAMGVAAAVSPGTGLLATALGVSVVALLAAATAILVVPAMLVVVGDNLGHGASASGSEGGASARLARLATRRPALGLVAAVVLLIACVPVLGLKTGAPSAESLPSGNSARAQYDTIAASMGAGWSEPFEIVAVMHKGAVTTGPRLRALARVQRKLAKDPAVRAVLGPGAIAASASRLRSSGRRALAASQGTPRREGGRLRRLGAGVSSAADGVGSLRSSLSSATSAATRVADGSRSIEGGVGDLQSGLDGAGSGARELAARLADAGRGTRGLASQSAAAVGGARALSDRARSLSGTLAKVATATRDLQGRLSARSGALSAVQSAVRAQRRQADDVLATAERSIMPTTSAALRARSAIARARTALAADPAAALDDPIRLLRNDSDYAGRIASAAPSQDAAELARVISTLADGAASLTARVRELDRSVGALSQGGGSLAKALGELDGGAAKISHAVAAVLSGATGLADGVRTGEQRTGALASGLDAARSAVAGLGGSDGAGGAGPTKKATSSFFDSGYFLLAALESSSDQPMGVNVDHGGQGARIVVVPRYPASDPRTQALYERLRTASAKLGRTLHADSAVGGPAATLLDYQSVAAERLPLIVIVLTLITALLLGLLLRSIVVPIIGVVLNLLAVGATLGLLALLFGGDAPLLGGPGVIDAVAVTAIFGVVFALSIDYQVFILSRVREEWLRCGDEERALHVGMSRTARVVTGAALSMLGVFVAFAFADVASLRQFGVGLAIAIVIDATLVRLVMLPAALYFAGEWTWYSGFDADPAPVAAPHPRLTFDAPAFESGSSAS